MPKSAAKLVVNPMIKSGAKPSAKPGIRADNKSSAQASSQALSSVESQTPALRLFALLEVVAAREQPFSLASLVQETGWPKPTLHRMLQQLEAASIVQRDTDARHYSSGNRLRALAQQVLIHSTRHGALHTLLRQLVDEVGESCNLTALSSGEVLYLDRVETSAPLRFYLHPGSRVPAHCSASGKLLLGQLSRAQRQQLLGQAPLARYTPNTLTSLSALEQEVQRCKEQGFALDQEEFLPGLFCIAVPVPVARGRSNLCVALQAPSLRVNTAQLPRLLPALQRTAQALALVWAQGKAL